ncbi:MAG TPA: N-acetylneuraminate lyase [Gammaproteobacteria bacterium]|nr:N-acetylneuraminate lyase [Gammaproteobacteria bacterium]
MTSPWENHLSIKNLSGLIAATFTPMGDDGALNLDTVPTIVERLISEGVSGLFVCGGNGEGVSLTDEERKKTAEAYVNAANGRIPVVVHVGQDSLFSARGLAQHAAGIGADGISAITPTYFKPTSTSALLDSLSVIAEGAPELPFVYYHFPVKSGVEIDLPEFIELAKEKLPSLYAIKFTDPRLDDLQSGLAASDIKIFYGIDEMLLGGLAAGASGAIGSTYNFAAPLYLKLMEAWEQNDISEARRLQALSVKMVRAFLPFGGVEGQKAIMDMIGLTCGPARLPLNKLTTAEIDQLQNNLNDIDFFDWARS